ncbi:MAG: helix-turn-helix domain-containing protein [Candidatus Omnitrophica bacterium]|nr:helix-turn-helix domain-containing protein [Candidatus Omnitrophota bacterium]
MAVRQSEDRRLGGGPEKLLTLEEAAQRLGVPADDVEAMVRSGKLPSFRLGGSLLRVRLKDVELMKSSSSGWERFVDFLYFNDFYLVAVLIALTLLAVILAL